MRALDGDEGAPVNGSPDKDFEFSRSHWSTATSILAESCAGAAAAQHPKLVMADNPIRVRPVGKSANSKFAPFESLKIQIRFTRTFQKMKFKLLESLKIEMCAF